MLKFEDIFKKSFLLLFENNITIKITIFTFFISGLLGLLIFLVYKNKSKTQLYSRDFNTTLVLLSIITSGIVLSMQSNLVVSLGMVGALSIVRFRNAVKNSFDLVFCFWAISVGIIVGAQLYSIAIILCFVMIIFIYGLDLLKFKSPYVLLVGLNNDNEDKVIEILKSNHIKFKSKSKNISKERTDLIIELMINNYKPLLEELKNIEGVTSLSMISQEENIRI